MLELIKKWLRRCTMTKNSKRHAAHRKYYSIGTAKSVGIVFQMQQGAIPKEVQALAKSCAERKQHYSMIGYYNADDLPPTFVGNKLCTVFTNKVLNWYGRPISDDVDRFVQTHLDMVIDCCREPDVYPLQYVVASAQTSMLVGGMLYPHCPYDLIVDAQQTCDLAGYIEQVLHYLSIIEVEPEPEPEPEPEGAKKKNIR